MTLSAWPGSSSEHPPRVRDDRWTGRTPATALFWRLFLLNALVFVTAAAVLAVSPATVSAPVLVTEVTVLAVGLVLMLARERGAAAGQPAPAGRADRADGAGGPAAPGRAAARCTGNGDVAHLLRTFNEMLDRLEAERGASSAQALAAQEGERQRIAQELHDEIGQSLTAVLLGLKRAVDRAPAELRDELRAVQELTRASLDEVRQVARRLRPGVLEDLGLISALSALATDFTAGQRGAGDPQAGPAAAGAEPGRGAGALPDRAGGPDQRRPARRRHPGASWR